MLDHCATTAPRSARRGIALALSLIAALFAPAALLQLSADAQVIMPSAAAKAGAPDSEKNIISVSNTDPKVTLPNGVTVELVGVTNDSEDQWWSASGAPVSEPVEHNRFHGVSWGMQGDQPRMLAIQLSANANLKGSTFGYIVDPTGEFGPYTRFTGKDMRLDDVDIKTGTPALGKIPLGFPSQRGKFTYRFAIATGDWATIATTKPTLHPVSGTVVQTRGGSIGGINIWLGDTPRMSYQETSGGYQRQDLLPKDLKIGNVARRIVALDPDGKEVILDNGGEDNSGNPSAALSEDELSHIAEFQIQTRPYEWVEFKDIAFNGDRVPGIPIPGPEIDTPKTLPKFHKLLPNGVAVDFIALVESRADGGQWWKPDGAVLSGPIKEYKWAGNVKPYHGAEHPRSFIVSLSSSTGQDVSMAMQVPGDVRRGSTYDHRSYQQPLIPGRPSVSATYCNFPEGTKSCMMRIGVAAGSWKTIVKLPLEVGKDSVQQRPNTPENQYQGDIDIWIRPQPTLGYVDVKGVSHVQKFLGQTKSLPDDVARRIVAVLADGSVVPLTPSGGGGNGTAIISLTYDRHRQVHMYNRDLDLSQVLEFRLQTRPYMWMKFTDIQLNPRD